MIPNLLGTRTQMSYRNDYTRLSVLRATMAAWLPQTLDPSIVVLVADAAAMATQRGGREPRAGGCRLRP